MSGSASRALAFLILVIGGANLALPGIGWGVAVQVAHGVFVPDVLILLYLLLMASAGTLDALLEQQTAVRLAAAVALLGAIGTLSAAVNPTRFFDIGQALHLLLFAFLTLLAAHWSARFGASWTLRSFLLGITAGGIVNLYYSFAIPKGLMGVLPVLYLQNGAGSALGIATILGAWLMSIRRSRGDGWIALVATAVGIAGSAISFSKTAMLACALGGLAWLCLLPAALRVPIGRTAAAVAVVSIVSMTPRVSAFVDSPLGRSVINVVQRKFAGIDVRDRYSVGTRYMYFRGVWEIVREHPFLGVSYGGFYDAITHTRSYATGEMVDEDPDGGRRGDSNPHNTFLYYAAANGVPGLFLSVVLFVMFFGSVLRALRPAGGAGLGMAACMILAYFIYSMTLPTLLNTFIMCVPAAVAIAAAAERQRATRAIVLKEPASVWSARPLGV